MSDPDIAQAFRRLQAGDPRGALAFAEQACARAPADSRAFLARGIALRTLGREEEARGALERAAALAPADYAPQYELGVLEEQSGAHRAALERFDRARALRPGFFPASFAAGQQALALAQWPAAVERLEEAARLQPGQREVVTSLASALRELGRECVRAADYASAARHFGAARALQPDDPDLPLYEAQVLLLLERWRDAWPPYARRDSRLEHERSLAARGKRYTVPALDALAGREVVLLAEQGLGDILFFMRYAPALRAAVRRIVFSGSPRLHALLERSGAVDACVAQAPDDAVLVADLPVVLGERFAPYAPSLRVAPEEARVAQWRDRLATQGPRPWTAATWRAGTQLTRESLSKCAPLVPLFRALAGAPGTVFALQRGLAAGELDEAAGALGRDVVDLSEAAIDVEDTLAIASLLDRHVAVSSTDLHLAALAGKTAEVLVPFPPEWRWGAQGDSPWFPGFRVLHQSPDGDWSQALERLSR